MRTEYYLMTDGHRPTKDEIEKGKREYRKITPPHLRFRNVLMTFSDVNYSRGFHFSEYLDDMKAEKV